MIAKMRRCQQPEDIQNKEKYGKLSYRASNPPPRTEIHTFTIKRNAADSGPSRSLLLLVNEALGMVPIFTVLLPEGTILSSVSDHILDVLEGYLRSERKRYIRISIRAKE